MPLRQRFARGTQSIGASARQPIQTAEVLAIELHAIRYQLHAVFVVKATAIAAIEQFACDVGGIKQSRLFIFELMDAATPTAVTQGFPLAPIKAREGLFPKGWFAIHFTSSLALLSAGNQAGKLGLRS